jgi:phage tail tape-measure protein
MDLFGHVGGAMAGRAVGAAIGTAIFPGVGTAIGGALGGVVGGKLGGQAEHAVGGGLRSSGAPIQPSIPEPLAQTNSVLNADQFR